MNKPAFGMAFHLSIAILIFESYHHSLCAARFVVTEPERPNRLVSHVPDDSHGRFVNSSSADTVCHGYKEIPEKPSCAGNGVLN